PAQYPRDKPYDGIRHCHAGELTSGQDIVTDGYFIGDKRTDALIIAFIVAAYEYDVVFSAQGFCHFLIERLSLRTHQYDARTVKVECIHGIENRFGFQY